MKIFKYLFLFITLFLSINAYSDTVYYAHNYSNTWQTQNYPTKEEACQAYFNLPQTQAAFPNAKYRETIGSDCYSVSNGIIGKVRSETLTCPSATEMTVKVPVNAPKYTCVNMCQIALTGCVDVEFEPGMTCGAITTGGKCGLNKPFTPKPSNDKGGNPDITSDGSNNNNDGSKPSTNSSNSVTNSTTTYDEQNNTWNTTTTTKTTIDTSSLENTITNNTDKLIEKFKCLTTGDCPKDGVDNGDGDGGLGDDLFGDSQIPEQQLTEKSLQTNLFATSNACPIDRTLSMNFLGRNFTHTFSFSQFCGYLSIIGTLILTFSYLGAAYIVVSKS